MKNIYARTCSEVLAVLDKVPKEQIDLIPRSVIENIQKSSGNNHETVKLEFDIFGQPKLLDESRAMILMIYQKYFLDMNHRELLEEKLKENDRIKEERLKRKLEDDIFYDKNSKTEVANQEVIIRTEPQSEQTIANEKSLICIKNSFLEKVKSFFKRIKDRIFNRS